MTVTVSQTYVLQPGDLVLDYAAYRPTRQLLESLGIKAVCRYIAQTTKIAGKLLTELETAMLHSWGIGVIPNYESYATRPDGGYGLGAVDGAFANDWATRVSYPSDCSIVASDDTNVTATTLPSHLNYQIGFDDNCAWGTGPYGDNDIMQACVNAGRSDQILWYAGARAWSGYREPIKECHFMQTVKGSVAGVYDMNHVLRPFNVWLPHEVQPGKDIDMSYLGTNAEARQMPWGLQPPGTEFFVVDTWRRGCSQDEKDHAWSGVTAKPLLNATLDAIPDAGSLVIPPFPPFPPVVIPPFPTHISLSGTVS